MVNGDRRGDPGPRSGDARSGRDQVRGRLGRRHAAGGGPVHRAVRRVRQRPGDAARTSPPRSGRRPARSPASRRSRCTSPITTSSTPGDTPNVLVAMNPAALKANLADLVAGLDAARSTSTRSTRATSTRRATRRTRCATTRSRAFRVYEVPMTSITVEATKPLGVKPRDAERSKNFFALGLICWMYTRPTEPLFDWIKKRFVEPARGARGEPRRVPRRLQLRRDRRAVRPPVRDQARAAAARRVPPDHRQRRAVVRPRRGGARRRSCRCSTRRTRSRPPPTSCTSSRS